jgi:hypothetical protein
MITPPGAPPPDPHGYLLDGAQPYVISALENAALCHSIGVGPATDGSAHPIYYYIATQIGMGASVAELCAACDFDIADGPMIVSSTAEFSAPLLVDQPYTVKGQIESLVRKNSRKLGVMDLVEYTLALLDSAHRTAVKTTTRWALPRKDLS